MIIRSPIWDYRATVDDFKYPPEYKMDAGYFSVTKTTKVQQIQEFVVYNVIPTYMDSLSTCKVAWDNNEKDHCFRLDGKSCWSCTMLWICYILTLLLIVYLGFLRASTGGPSRQCGFVFDKEGFLLPVTIFQSGDCFKASNEVRTINLERYNESVYDISHS